MHFTFKGQRYRVRFGYATYNHRKRGLLWGHKALVNLKDRYIETYCDIAKIDGMDKDNKPIYNCLAGDFVTRDPRDTFIKDEGRRRALSRALYQIRDRELRSAIWQEYYKQHKLSGGLVIKEV